LDKWEESFLRELVELDTNSDEKKNYMECADVVRRYCEEAGLSVEVFDSNHDGRPQPNVVATLDAGGKNTILLCTHYDVVPAGDEGAWTRPPFKLTVEKNRAYGRGVSDNKGNIVACVSAAKGLLKTGNSKANYRILISPNEEIGGKWGIDYLINGPPKIRGDFAVVVDSGPSYVSIGASGVIAGKITVHGTQGHAGYPFAYNNAIHLSIPLLNEMLGYIDVRRKVESTLPAPPGSPHQNLWGRFSMTVYKAGSKTNIIPGKAEISFDCRLIPEEKPKDVEKSITEFFEAAKEETFIDATLEILMNVHGWRSDPDDKYVKLFHSAVQNAVAPEIPIAADLGGNDGHFFTEVGIPTVCYGTLADDNNYHGIDEFMWLEDFEKVKRALVQFAEMC
jgi:acetylornithine deacetylase/succinyl-diaminopimelate desuccinylase family protein